MCVRCVFTTLNTLSECWWRTEPAAAFTSLTLSTLCNTQTQRKRCTVSRTKTIHADPYGGAREHEKGEEGYDVPIENRGGSESRGGEVWVQGKRKGDFHGTAEGWHKQYLAYEGHRRIMLTASTYNSFSSTFCLSPCPLVRLEPVLGQLAARYHYLLDSGQSNLSACSCFIELDKYNMWLTAIIYYRTALFIQQAEALAHLNWPLSLFDGTTLKWWKPLNGHSWDLNQWRN